MLGHAQPAPSAEPVRRGPAQRSGQEAQARSLRPAAGNLAATALARDRVPPLTEVQPGLGNLAVQRLCSACSGAAHDATAGGVRVLGAPGDPWEREADRVADVVTAAPAVPTRLASPPSAKGHRHCPACAAELGADEVPVQRDASGAGPMGAADGGSTAAGGAAPPGAAAALARSGPGMPMSASARNRIEPVVGADLSEVRVHADGHASLAAAELGARAFARGNDIFLARGQDPGDTRLLAHESAHVVQQRGVREPAIQRDGGGAGAESHADETESQFAERVKTAAVARLNRNIAVLGEWSTYVSAMDTFQLQSQLLAGHVQELAQTAAPTPGGRQRFERYAGTEQAGERLLEGSQLDPQAGYRQRVGGEMAFLVERTHGYWTTRSVAQRLGERAGVTPAAGDFESVWVPPDPRYAEYTGAIDRWLSGESGGCQTCHDINRAWGRTADLWGDPLPRGRPYAALEAASRSLTSSGLLRGTTGSDSAALQAYVASLSATPTSGAGTGTAAATSPLAAAATRGGPFRPDLDLPKGVVLPPPRSDLCGPLPPAEDEGSARDRFDSSLWGPNASLALTAVARIGAVLRPLGPRGYRILERSTFDDLWAAGPSDLVAQRGRIVAAIAAKQDAYRDLIGSIQGGSVNYQTLCPIVDELLPSTNALLRFQIESDIRTRRAIETLIGWFDLALTALNIIYPPSVLATLPLRAASGLVKLAIGAEQLREAPTLERAQGSGVISAYQESTAEGIRTRGWMNLIAGGIDLLGVGVAARAARPPGPASFEDVLSTRGWTASRTEAGTMWWHPDHTGSVWQTGRSFEMADEAMNPIAFVDDLGDGSFSMRWAGGAGGAAPGSTALVPFRAPGTGTGAAADLEAGILRSDWESGGLFGLQRESYLPRLENESIEAWQQRMVDDINTRLVAPHLDPAFQTRGEVFEGAWFDRPRGVTEFSEEELTIYFGRTQALNKQTVGEELQHTHDYLLGARRTEVGRQVRDALFDDIRVHGPLGRVTPEGGLTEAGVEWANKWWHRRVYTRLMQNANAGRHGLGYLSPHLEQLYDFYRVRLDGPLSLEEILRTTWEGLY